jgi:hypothetical protein
LLETAGSSDQKQVQSDAIGCLAGLALLNSGDHSTGKRSDYMRGTLYRDNFLKNGKVSKAIITTWGGTQTHSGFIFKPLKEFQ